MYEYAVANGALWHRSNSAGDDKVRDTHDLDEQEGWIPIDQPYAASGRLFAGDDTAGASEVVNCRCNDEYSWDKEQPED